ncbi:MAG: PHP domain-containing protein [Tissierellia bacterium]|nr:PHP domain-containing protein [Tissierellia bacterium]MDD4726370.1 PHP domain-containing protein [Tissierellia bacterium]
MIIDCHLHEDKYSFDSRLGLYDAINKAKDLGIDGICVTNHDNNLLRQEIGDSAIIDGVLVIVGAEVFTFEGDILTFGLNDIPEERISAEELLTMVNKNHGVAIAAHPFRDNNRGIGNHMIRLAPMLSGVEAFNGSTKYHHNMQAYNLAKKLNLPVTGAGDAHVVDNVGIYATSFEDDIRDHIDFIEAVKARKFYPVSREELSGKEISTFTLTK